MLKKMNRIDRGYAAKQSALLQSCTSRGDYVKENDRKYSTLRCMAVGVS